MELLLIIYFVDLFLKTFNNWSAEFNAMNLVV